MPKSKIAIAVVAAVSVIAIGTGVVLAAGGDDDRPLQGNAYDRATDAARRHTGGGTVIETELGDGGAAYAVEIKRDDGSVVEVSLDDHFKVVGVESDEDEANDGDGPGDGD